VFHNSTWIYNIIYSIGSLLAGSMLELSVKMEMGGLLCE